MQLEAATRQRLERGAVTPIQGQESARLAGRGAGDAGALDDDRPDAAASEKIGDRRPDHPAATDHHAHWLSAPLNALLSESIGPWRDRLPRCGSVAGTAEARSRAFRWEARRRLDCASGPPRGCREASGESGARPRELLSTSLLSSRYGTAVSAGACGGGSVECRTRANPA